MGSLIILGMVGIPCLVALLWFLTPSGKRWLKDNHMIWRILLYVIVVVRGAVKASLSCGQYFARFILVIVLLSSLASFSAFSISRVSSLFGIQILSNMSPSPVQSQVMFSSGYFECILDMMSVPMVPGLPFVAVLAIYLFDSPHVFSNWLVPVIVLFCFR